MKKIAAVAIALIPFNRFRIFLYRVIFRYDISYKSYIANFNIIICKRLKVEDDVRIMGWGNIILDINEVVINSGTAIGKLNRFRSFNKLFIGKDVTVRSKNMFFGTFDDISPYKEFENIQIGNNSIITSKHIFDLSDEIIIGEDVTFGGSGSQIWTHGFDLDHVKIQSRIKIGNRCYIGSMAMLMPGCDICDDVSIGAGCLVSKKIIESGFYISSQLIRKSDNASYKDHKSVVNQNGYKFYRK